jgi:3-phenylpropionate/cinnamic acid dioxygenase small subunit
VIPSLPVEDRLAIEALVTEYAWLLDHRRFEEVVGLCTEDCELRIRGVRIDGADGLREWLDQRATSQSRRASQHQMSLLRLEPVGGGNRDVVAGTAALVLHVAKSGSSGSYIDLVGEYQDEYVKSGAGWRFRRRTLVTLADM